MVTKLVMIYMYKFVCFFYGFMSIERNFSWLQANGLGAHVCINTERDI